MQIQKDEFLDLYSEVIAKTGDAFWLFGFWRFTITYKDGESELTVHRGKYEDAIDQLDEYIFLEVGLDNIDSVELVCNAIVQFPDSCCKRGCINGRCFFDK